MPLFTTVAVKEQLKARVAIDGPTGSGKTWTALQWARILAGPDGPVGLIDTEDRSAAYYAPAPGQAVQRQHFFDPPYDFLHLPVRAPYSPLALGKMIDAAVDDLGADGVLVVDSLTPYWFGEGGTLDIVDHAGKGNSYAGWKEGSPAQRYMIDQLTHAPFHVVVTMRSKMAYVLQEQQNKAGRTVQVPTKVGMEPEQRAGIEYEFTLVCDMDLSHTLTVGKSRCDEVADRVAHKGRSAEVAMDFKDWLGTGFQRVSEAQARDLVAAFNPIGDAAERSALKASFKAVYGTPDELDAAKLEEAMAWVQGEVARVTGPAQPPVDPKVLQAALGELDDDELAKMGGKP